MLLAPIFVGLILSQVPEPPPAVALTWQVPPGCPDRDALARAITERLGRPLAPGEAQVEGRITRRRTAPGYRLRLRLSARDRSDERELFARACPPLIDATALLVVLAVGGPEGPGAPATADGPAAPDPAIVPADPAPDPPVLEVRDDEAPPETPDDPPPPPVLETREDAPPLPAPVDPSLPAPEPADTPPRPRRPGGFVRLQGGPEIGAVPGLTGAAGLAAGVLWPRARLEFHGVFLAPRTARRDDTQLHVLAAAGAVLGCARPRRARLEFPLCAGLEFGAMRGVARGPGARTATGPWLAAPVSAGAAWHLDARWSLSLALQGVVRLYSPRFELRDPGPAVTLFEPAVLSGRLLLGVELRLGGPP